MKKFEAVNWNTPDDNFTQLFYEQNVKQFWLPEEFVPSKDIKIWNNILTDNEKSAYRKALAGLTALDTEQNVVGMPKILEHVESLQRKMVLSYMSMMEGIHAKSYSTIFTTIDKTEDINEVFEWVKENKYVQTKMKLIDKYYVNIKDKESLYMAMVASVYLESYLFYSSFFYPLYLAGQGKMIASGEVINLIIRDEAIHGVYVGLLAQELFNEFDNETQQRLYTQAIELMEDLMKNEFSYTEELYAEIGLDSEVKEFLKYNANKALMNLGFEPHYEESDINAIVLNGLSTETKTFDFFSNKGNGYQKGIVKPVTDDTFSSVNTILEKAIKAEQKMKEVIK